MTKKVNKNPCFFTQMNAKQIKCPKKRGHFFVISHTHTSYTLTKCYGTIQK